MNQKLKEEIRNAFQSVLPISVIVLVLSTFLVPIPLETVVLFIVGTILTILGMGFFQLGAEVAMIPMGEGIGKEITKVHKMALLIVVCFSVGFIITVAEPDLAVLADQVFGIPNSILIFTVAAGVGIFLVIAVLRIIFHISLSKMLFIFYTVVFFVSIFVPNNFLGVAFDSGGVTTGPITVPFILSLGAGIASMRSDKESQDDSFGFVALCSIGPILAVMILGITYHPKDTVYQSVTIPKVQTMLEVLHQFSWELPHYLKEVFLAIFPIIAFFILFQVISKRYRRRQLIRVSIGILYTLIGLVLYLTGVNVGFIPVGKLLGDQIATSTYKWLLIPCGMLIGYFIVAAEPAVHVLNKQVEEISEGAIPQKAMNRALSVGVMVSVGLSMLRVLTGISIYWFLIPGYIIALLLTFRVPKIITGIAFDSGGVASGPMTSTFLLPFTMGACKSLGGDVLTDAFGVVAMVAMTPLIAIQIMGLIYTRKNPPADTDEWNDENIEEITDLEDDIKEVCIRG